MRTLAGLLLGIFLVGYATNLFGQDLSAFVVDVSDMADGTISQARLEAQRQAASGGLPFRSFRKGEYRKFVGQITPPELPEDKKDRFVYGLALFSDDGCTLTLNGSYIISRLGRGQHLPNLGESFHELPVVLTPGKSVEVVLDYMNTIYFVDPKRPIPDIDGFTIFLFLIPVEMVADYNRDGAIDDKDRGRVSEQQPFRWWLNDDDDNGDLGHEDTPLGIASSQADASLGNNQVDGSCDLIDWFPLFLDIKHLFSVLPPAQHEYYLKQENAALNFVYTDLQPEEVGTYLRNGVKADDLKSAQSFLILANGTTRIATEFLSKIENDGKGIILLEGGNVTNKPLYLQVLRDGRKLVEIPFWLKIDGVEKMYRWINVRANAGAVDRVTDVGEPPNYPDNESNDKMFVFVHGYNVNEQQSRGWIAEAFKRLYRSGSRSMFTGVSWHGNSSQTSIPGYGSVALDYWENVTNAFKSSSSLAVAVNSLPGSIKISAAHSLGNLLVSSALTDHGMKVSMHFLLDAAVAIEAYDSSASNVAEMRDPAWSVYNTRLWAAEWYRLFDASDGRNKLSWRNRFGGLPFVYNFYSSGEDVLNNSTGQIPAPGADRVWALQEMVKGTNHPGALLTLDSQGGWGFNRIFDIEEAPIDGSISTYRPRTPEEADQLTDEQLRVEPFFRRFKDKRLLIADQGSAAAYEYLTRAKTLAEAIPALSFAVGRNEVGAFLRNNIDLMTLKDGWPSADGRWRHGDAKDVSYRYNHKLYEHWVDLGALK